jgi:hypothetical protein
MRNKLIPFFIVSVCLQFSVLITVSAQESEFRAHLIDEFPGGYKVAAADLNRDGRPDIIGLSTNPANLVWYENPTWTKHVITTQTKENIDLAVADINGDGRLDLALANQFSMSRTDAGGLVHWLKCPEDPTREWEMRYIDDEPTSHRLLWADIFGNGTKNLVNVPIMGRNAKEPDWNVGVNLLWYSAPEDPEKTDDPAHSLWDRKLIDNSLTVIHGASIVDWDGDGHDDILTASFEGVHVFMSNVSGKNVFWKKRHVGAGYQTDEPARGASEIALGQIGSKDTPFLASIEPWHGNNVVVYTLEDGLWMRRVVDSTFNGGHALVSADVDGDGTDEIIAGYRGKGASLFLYRTEGTSGVSGKSWERTTLDDGDMATSGLCTADINGDGMLDIIAVGSSTGNIKWYENLGVK